MFVDEAQAQAAEATKAAVDAGNVLLQYQAIGAFCLFLILAVGVLAWMLHRAHERHNTLLERVVVVAESSKNAHGDTAEAVERLTDAVNGLAKAVDTVSREMEGEARENRHTLTGIAAGVNGIANRLQALPRIGAG